MIKSLGKSQLLGMINYSGSSNDQYSVKKLFAQVSLACGGDGQTLTKKQLKAYLDKCQHNSKSVNPKKLRLAKMLYDNWDKLFDGAGKISAGDYNKAAGIFNGIVMSEAEEEQDKAAKEEKEEKKEKELAEKKKKEAQEKFDKLKEKLNSKKDLNDEKELSGEKQGITKDQLEEYLKKLLKKNSIDDDEFEVDFIVNLLGNFENLSGKTDSIKDFKKITEYTSNEKLSSEDFKTPIHLSV